MSLSHQIIFDSVAVCGWEGIPDMCRFYCRQCQYQWILGKVRMKKSNVHNVIPIMSGGVGLRYGADCLSGTV